MGACCGKTEGTPTTEYEKAHPYLRVPIESRTATIFDEHTIRASSLREPPASDSYGGHPYGQVRLEEGPAAGYYAGRYPRLEEQQSPAQQDIAVATDYEAGASQVAPLRLAASNPGPTILTGQTGSSSATAPPSKASEPAEAAKPSSAAKPTEPAGSASSKNAKRVPVRVEETETSATEQSDPNERTVVAPTSGSFTTCSAEELAGTSPTERSDPLDNTVVNSTLGSYTDCSAGEADAARGVPHADATGPTTKGAVPMSGKFTQYSAKQQQPLFPERDPDHFKLLGKRVLEGQMRLNQNFFQHQGARVKSSGLQCPSYPVRSVCAPVERGEKGFFSGVADWFTGGRDRSAGELGEKGMVQQHSQRTSSTRTCGKCSHPITSHHVERAYTRTSGSAPQPMQFTTVESAKELNSKNITEEETFGGEVPPSPMVYLEHNQIKEEAECEKSKNVTDEKTFEKGPPPSPMVYRHHSQPCDKGKEQDALLLPTEKTQELKKAQHVQPASTSYQFHTNFSQKLLDNEGPQLVVHPLPTACQFHTEPSQRNVAVATLPGSCQCSQQCPTSAEVGHKNQQFTTIVRESHSAVEPDTQACSYCKVGLAKCYNCLNKIVS